MAARIKAGSKQAILNVRSNAYCVTCNEFFNRHWDAEKHEIRNHECFWFDEEDEE